MTLLSVEFMNLMESPVAPMPVVRKHGRRFFESVRIRSTKSIIDDMDLFVVKPLFSFH